MKNKLLLRLASAALAISMLNTVPAFAANETGNEAQSTVSLMAEAVSSGGAGSEAVSYEL